MARDRIRDFDRLSSRSLSVFDARTRRIVGTWRIEDRVSYGPSRWRSATATVRALLGAGSVLRLIRDGEAVTRADLARRTGLARSTVAQRVDALLAHELVYEAGDSASTGGRPPTVLAFNHARRRRARRRPRRDPLAPRGQRPRGRAARRGGARAWTSPTGPEAVLERVARALRRAARARPAATPADVRGIGVGVPGPGRVRDRPARQPADHARLGRLLDPALVRRRATTRRCSSTTT